MRSFFDSYELTARIAPTVVIFSPLLVLAAIWIYLVSPPILTFAPLLLFLVVYPLSLYIRVLGRSTEPQLWKAWGGAPSTKIMRSDDNTLSTAVRNTIATVVFEQFGIDLYANLGTEEDQRIEDAFRLVRQRIRQSDPTGLWFRHNAEYGFLRNLYGSRGLWRAASLLGLTISCYFFVASPNGFYLISCLFSCIVCLLALRSHSFLPKSIQAAADRYAENAWMSFWHLETK